MLETEDILPKVLSAGENAGSLLRKEVKLDVSGHLKAGIPVCPPEGDAGTGMVATNAVKATHRKCIGRHFLILYDCIGERFVEAIRND